jgi:hypothetical protein
MSVAEKESYLNGYYDALMFYKYNILKEIETDEDDLKIWGFFPKEMTWRRLILAINDLYDDPRNLTVSVEAALQAVAMRENSISEEAIERFLKIHRR